MGRYVEEEIINQPISLDELSDVNSPSPTDGELLEYDILTNEWVNVSTLNGGSF